MSYHYYPYHHSAEKHKLVYDVSHIKIIAAFTCIKNKHLSINLVRNKYELFHILFYESYGFSLYFTIKDSKKYLVISHPYIYKIGYQFLFLQWLHFTTLLSQPKNRIGSGYEALHHHRIAKTKSWTLQKVVSNYLHRNLSNFFSIRNILF